MGFLQRGLLIYLTIAIAICLTMPSAIFNADGTPAEKTVLSFFNVALNSSDNTVGVTSATTSDTIADGTGAFTTISSPSSSGSLIGFIDPVFQVFSWVGIFFKVLFSPIIMLMSPAATGIPAVSNALLFIIGLPLVLMMIVGLITWIRSGFT